MEAAPALCVVATNILHSSSASQISSGCTCVIYYHFFQKKRIDENLSVQINIFMLIMAANKFKFTADNVYILSEIVYKSTKILEEICNDVLLIIEIMT